MVCTVGSFFLQSTHGRIQLRLWAHSLWKLSSKITRRQILKKVRVYRRAKLIESRMQLGSENKLMLSDIFLHTKYLGTWQNNQHMSLIRKIMPFDFNYMVFTRMFIYSLKKAIKDKNWEIWSDLKPKSKFSNRPIRSRLNTYSPAHLKYSRKTLPIQMCVALSNNSVGSQAIKTMRITITILMLMLLQLLAIIDFQLEL